MLTFDHVGQRLERTLVRARDSTAASTVIEQRVHRLLQHALLIANNDIGRIQIQQTLQAVVTVNDSAIKIVQVRGGETAAI